MLFSCRLLNLNTTLLWRLIVVYKRFCVNLKAYVHTYSTNCNAYNSQMTQNIQNNIQCLSKYVKNN